jgi:alkylhydroperoxidase family enzyme
MWRGVALHSAPLAGNHSGMSRLPPADAGPLVRATYAYSKRNWGKVPEPQAIAAHHPKLLAGWSAMELATERSHKMPDRYKMLAEMKAAVLAGCEWCIDIGAFLLDRGGVPSEQVRNILRHRDSDAFDELEKLVLDYAEGMTRTPVDVSDELFAALREHFDPAQLVELTSIIALENYRARFNWALGIESQGFADGAACPMPARDGAAA